MQKFCSNVTTKPDQNLDSDSHGSGSGTVRFEANVTNAECFCNVKIRKRKGLKVSPVSEDYENVLIF